MRKSLTWVAVGTTVAAAALSVAGTASASTAPAKTTLTIRESASKVVAGASVTISGTLSKGHTVLGNELVQLDTVGPHGVLHPVRGKDNPTAHGTGVVTFKVTPEATTTYELSFPGARGLARSWSGKATVKVVKRPTHLSISAPTTPVTIGTKETFTGTLVSGTKALAGRLVYLFTLNSKKEVVRVAGHGTTSAAGTVSITTTPPVGTDFYALVYGGTWQYARAVSAVDTVTVHRIATTLTLSSSATAPVAKGTKVTLTGTLTAGTNDLSGQTVVLQVLVNGKWVDAQSGVAKTVAGKVTFTRAPSATTSYRVVFRGTANYATAASTTVVVAIS
jgi:hypothetical protein